VAGERVQFCSTHWREATPDAADDADITTWALSPKGEIAMLGVRDEQGHPLLTSSAAAGGTVGTLLGRPVVKTSHVARPGNVIGIGGASCVAKDAPMRGEVLEVIGHVFAGGGGEVEVMDLVDDYQVGASLGQYLAHGIGDVVGVVSRLV
jgi:hypothetical protein